MDTNLKKSKKFKAFCYRMIAVGALITTIATAFMGREAFVNLSREGRGTLSGDIYYLTEFREYISFLYENALITYAGPGDDAGNPLVNRYSASIVDQAHQEIPAKINLTRGDLFYSIQYFDQEVQEWEDLDPYSTPVVFSQEGGYPLLPENMKLCCFWDGSAGRVYFFSSGQTIRDWGATEEDSAKKLFPIKQLYTYSDQYYTAQYRADRENVDKLRLVFAVRDDGIYSSNYLRGMAERARGYQHILILFFVSGLLMVVFGVLSLVSRKAAVEAQKDYAAFTRKIWLEIKLILLIGFFAVLVFFGLNRGMDATSLRIGRYSVMWLYFPMGCILYLFFTDLRCNHIVALKNFFPVKLFNFVKTYVGGKPWHRRAMNMYAFIGVSAVLTLIGGIGNLYISNYMYEWRQELQNKELGFLLIAVGIVLTLVFIRLRRFVKDNRRLTDELSLLQEGRPGGNLQLSDKSLLKQAAADLNALEDGIENAVEQKNRSNKMRVELITNVSHDLKTPLTSIINYADLLCEENLEPPAAEYAEALRSKAYRLKTMVQDVFELSKATSGNLPVEMVKLDLVKLVHQTLADMDERIRESNLTFKLHVAEEPLFIEADGEKLYRVFQNLFVNALQYSLDHSRVHILLTAENGFALAKVKNTSLQELDFDPAEIVERFVRADSARTTEGSGLGLSIVQSFTEACGGTFQIALDADLFTACVRFPLAEME